MPTHWERNQLRPTQGVSKATYQNKKWGDQIRAWGDPSSRGEPQHPENQENIRIAKLLEFCLWIMYDRRQFVETIQ